MHSPYSASSVSMAPFSLKLLDLKVSVAVHPRSFGKYMIELHVIMTNHLHLMAVGSS